MHDAQWLIHNVVMTRLDQLAQQWAPATAILGGLAWIAYTMAALLQPWGSYATYGAPQGAPTISNIPAFLFTSLLGGLALLVLGSALAGTARRMGLPAQLPGRFGMALGLVGGATGLVMAAAAFMLHMTLAAAAMNAGAIMVAVGALLLASDGAGQRLAMPLFIVGALGVTAIFAAALVSLATWMLPVYAALVMAVYGFAWVRLGDILGKTR